MVAMNGLRAHLIESQNSSEGLQAELMLVEPNGDEHRVRCLCKADGSTEICGDGESIDYLHEKYGERTVWALSRQTTLG